MYRQVWVSDQGSAIYCLVRPDDFSAMHRLSGPEVWHYYVGSPLQMVLLHLDGTVERPVLGLDLAAGERPMVVVEAGTWMGACTRGEWTLLGTTMAPPFSPHGFELGDRQSLLLDFPQAAAEIESLTRAPL